MAQPARSNLPYSDHPLYKLRIATVIATIVGFLLDLFALLALVYDGNYLLPIFFFSIVLLFTSLLFVLHDLVTYAVRTASRSVLPIAVSPPSSQRERTEDGGTQDWPSRRLLIIDVILAVVLQWLFWIGFFAIIGTYHRTFYSGAESLEAYANLANFVASILHAIAFWKELMARKKVSWRTRLEERPCENCGHTSKSDMRNGILHASKISPEHPGIGEAGPSDATSGLFGNSKMTLPKWARGPSATQYEAIDDGDHENGTADASASESLLVTPDESAAETGQASRSRGYGTLEESAESVSSVPETIVKKKDKGKRRMVEVM